MGKLLKLNEKLDFEVIETESNEVSYEELKDAIGGYFERVTFNKELMDARINMFVDEEGKLKGLPVTVVVYDYESNKVIETLNGPVVFTAMDDPDTPSLSNLQIEVIKQVLSNTITCSTTQGWTQHAKILKYK